MAILETALRQGQVGIDLTGAGQNVTSTANLVITNNTGSPLELTIARGAAFSPDSSGHQTMVCTRDTTVTVPPEGATVPLPTVCASAHTLKPPPLAGGLHYAVGTGPPDAIRVIDAVHSLDHAFSSQADSIGMPVTLFSDTVGQYAIWAQSAPTGFGQQEIVSLLQPALQRQGLTADQVATVAGVLWTGVSTVLGELDTHDVADESPHTYSPPPKPGDPPVLPMDPNEPRDPESDFAITDRTTQALQLGMMQKGLQKDAYAPAIRNANTGVDTYLVPDPVFVAMAPGDKLTQAFQQAYNSGELGEGFKDAIAAMVSPEALAFFLGFIALQFVPGVDVAVDAAAAAMLLIYVGGLSVDFVDAMTAVARAQNKQQFDRAVKQLAQVIGQIGVGALTALAGAVAGKALKRIKSKAATAEKAPVAEGAPEPTAEPAPSEPAGAQDPFDPSAQVDPRSMSPAEWQIHVISRYVRILKAWAEVFGKDIPPERLKAAEAVKVTVTDQAGLNAEWQARNGSAPPGDYPGVRFTDANGEQTICTTTDNIHIGAHETGHTLQNPSLRKMWGPKAFEAFNEYFTQELLDSYGGKQPCSYVTNGSTTVVGKIIKLLGTKGEELARSANFGKGPGEVDALRVALDRATAPGTTNKVMTLIAQGQAPQAGALLDTFAGGAK